MPPGAPVINALFKQRACIENVFRACVGLSPDSHMGLEHKRGVHDTERLSYSSEAPPSAASAPAAKKARK